MTNHNDINGEIIPLILPNVGSGLSIYVLETTMKTTKLQIKFKCSLSQRIVGEKR